LQEVYADNPEKLAEIKEAVEQWQKATAPYYANAKEVGTKVPGLDTYSDHNLAHPNEVAASVAQNLQTVKAHEEAANLPPEARVNDRVMIGAALFHDTGMMGSKEEWGLIKDGKMDQVNGNQIRSNHAKESANRILENSDQFANRQEALEAACVTYLHTKSNSGVKTTGDSQAMLNAINSVKSNFETVNPESEKVDLSCFGKVNEKGQLTELNPQAYTRLCNETLLIRVGDAQRPASDAPMMMNGTVASVEKTQYQNTAGFQGDLADELAGKTVSYANPENPAVPVGTSEKDASVKYCSGERNVDAGVMRYTQDGKVEITMVVRDAYVDQAATKAILAERMKEGESVPSKNNAPPGAINRDDVSHVIIMEKGDEAARSALEQALKSSVEKTSDPDKTQVVQHNVRVELKEGGKK
jgi:hypothetical protein